jgi:hypothetical protein
MFRWVKFAKAAKAARGIAPSSLNHQDIIDALELTLGRLEEDYSGVEREFEDLEDAMNSTRSSWDLDNALDEKV